MSTTKKPNKVLQKIRSHSKQASFNSIEAHTQEKHKRKVFKEFCRATGLHPPNKISIQEHPQEGRQLYIDFIYYLQRIRKIACDFAGARAYTATVTRQYKLDVDPLDTLSSTNHSKLKRAYNKQALVNYKPKIAFDDSKFEALIKACHKPHQGPHSLFNSKRSTRRQLLGLAFLTYKVTGLRAGNILLGTGDNRAIHVLKIRNIFTNNSSGKCNPRGPIFIINDGKKGSKKPIITGVPFNPHTNNPKLYCAATGLLRLRNERMRQGASIDDPLFINPFSNKPLSTSVANTFIQDTLKSFFARQHNPKSWATLYSLKSARKALASRLEEMGCSPQTIAKQLHHSSLNSQMSYICTFFNKKQSLVRAMYDPTHNT